MNLIRCANSYLANLEGFKHQREEQCTKRARLNYFTASSISDGLNYNFKAEHDTSFVAQ